MGKGDRELNTYVNEISGTTRLLPMGVIAIACAVALPRSAHCQAGESPADWSVRAGLTVAQTAAETDRGFHARVLTTVPANAATHRLPAVLFIPWLSCDPVEVQGPTDDGYIRFVRDLSAQSGMVVSRVEKSGVAGSEGPDCAVSTLDDDFAAFRAGLKALSARPDVDTTKVFLVGGSIGGAFAVTLAAESGYRFAGVVSVNSFARTWYEHMIDHERWRLTFADTTGEHLGDAMRGFELLYTGFLIQKLTPRQVIAAHPELRRLWYDTTTGQYGRSAAYFHQVQALDVDRALSSLNVPALFVGGEYDWVMGAQEPGFAAARVNRFHPGRATSRVYAGLSHGIHTYGSALNAYHGLNGKYDPMVATDVSMWLRRIAGLAD
jgi:pimeloyl-ACP methyl ester carboxylesterase